MKKFGIYCNETFEEEEALVDLETGETILSGDYYHDKIYEKIKGFIACLDYLGIEYEVKHETLSPDNPKFSKVPFNDNSF